MGQLPHGRATTTPHIREKIQASNISIAKLAKLYNRYLGIEAIVCLG